MQDDTAMNASVKPAFKRLPKKIAKKTMTFAKLCALLGSLGHQPRLDDVSSAPNNAMLNPNIKEILPLPMAHGTLPKTICNMRFKSGRFAATASNIDGMQKWFSYLESTHQNT